jgi:hypothetical protein
LLWELPLWELTLWELTLWELTLWELTLWELTLPAAEAICNYLENSGRNGSTPIIATILSLDVRRSRSQCDGSDQCNRGQAGHFGTPKHLLEFCCFDDTRHQQMRKNSRYGQSFWQNLTILRRRSKN